MAEKHFALFAGGCYYPNGGWGDMRGRFASVEECEEQFVLLGPEMMLAQGYCLMVPRKGDVWGHVVDLRSCQIVKTLAAGRD